MSDADEQPPNKRGRLKDPAFLQLMADLQQHDEEQTTVNDLIDNMRTYLSQIFNFQDSLGYLRDSMFTKYGFFLVLLTWRLTTTCRNFLRFPTAQVTNTKRQHKQEMRGI